MPSTATSAGFFLVAGPLCAMSGLPCWLCWTGECPPASTPSPWNVPGPWPCRPCEDEEAIMASEKLTAQGH